MKLQLSNSTVQDLFLLTHHLTHSSCSWQTQCTMTKLCHVMSRISNNVHRQRLVVVEYVHCTCKIEAVSII